MIMGGMSVKSRICIIHRIVFVSVLFILLLCLTACQESTSSKYERANKLLTESKYTEAAAIFDEISTYEDASKMSLYTKAINAAETGDYETAFSTFTSLGEFKDCPMMITYYKGRQDETSVYDGVWIYGDKWFDAIEIYESIPLFRDSKERAENCRKAAYDQAIKSGDEGDTSFAISILETLGTYSDAAKQITYYQAIALLNQGDYSGASSIFNTIPGFRDADNRVTEVFEDGYKAAAAKEEAGELDEANAIFLNLGEYKDSADRAYKLYYDAGLARREAGDWDGARVAFTKAGGYSDATEQIKEITYQEATALEESGDQEGAYKLFISLGEYKDSFERANKPYYDLGIQKMNAGEWIAAITAFSHVGNYNDAEEQMHKAYYSQGEVLRDAKDWDGAITAFTNAEDYNDAVTQIKAIYYVEGVAKQKAEDWNGAVEAFAKADDYSDAETQISETNYLYSKSLMNSGDYEGAFAILINLKGYRDADILFDRASKLKLYQDVGGYVIFGTYPQTAAGNDQTPIEWIVLDYDKTNHKVLLLSRYALEDKPYNMEETNITWETCTLRSWLNSEFMDKAFSMEEQSAILTTAVDNSQAQHYNGGWFKSASGGNDTQDKIFLLSYAEAKRYLDAPKYHQSNKKLLVAATEYAIKTGAYAPGYYETEDGRSSVEWYLRSPGEAQNMVARISTSGDLCSLYVGSDHAISVRPALWLDLELFASDL